MIKSKRETITLNDLPDYKIIPDIGGWVMIKGNPFAPRHFRIPDAISDEGVRHLDIYWAFNERLAFNIVGRIPSYYDQHDIVDQIIDIHNISSLQLTKVTISHPGSNEVCFYSGEVSPIKQESIELLLQDECLDVIRFSGNDPIIEEATRDILGSYMIDGLSLAEAQSECMRSGEFEADEFKPPHFFYRASGPFKNMFSEHVDS